MAMTYRDEKGSPLSADEVDENFRTLQEAIDGFTSTPGVGVASITQAGSTITFHMTDGSTEGPFDLPTASFNDTGDWQPEWDYNTLDLFEVPNVGLYLVLIAHTSGTVFDPNLADSDANPMLKFVIATSNGPQSITYYENPGDIDLLPTDMRNRYLRIFQEAPLSITVRDDATLATDEEPLPVLGDTFTFRQVGAGQITFVQGGTTVINTPETLTTRKQGATVTLIYIGNSEYDLAGDLELLPAEPVTTEPFLTTTGP